jgi:hypothetical protein
MSDPIADVLAVDAAVLRATGADSFGVTADGFAPKPFARLLAEKLALARALLGDDLDLSSGSAVRKLLELTALEDARTWAALAAMYDNSFVSTATGEALSRLGEELGLKRPFLEARGRVKLKLKQNTNAAITIPRGTRMVTSGGHHVATDEGCALAPTNREKVVSCVAFYPGKDHNLNPATDPQQKLTAFHPLDPQAAAPKLVVDIDHTEAFTGGEGRWPDERYRQLLLRAPRSVWTVDAIQTAVSLVPGVRQAQIRDGWGGLDIHQSIFGNFNFLDRLFSAERDIGSPYYFSVLIAPTPAAVWAGPGGLRVAVESVIEDLRPIGIFPRILEADEVGVGVGADLVVRGLPLPSGTRDAVNASAAAIDLKKKLLDRVRQYVDGLMFGEPVRASEVTWALMNQPEVTDVRNLKLYRFPPRFAAIGFASGGAEPQTLGGGQNVDLQANEIATFVDDSARLWIV